MFFFVTVKVATKHPKENTVKFKAMVHHMAHGKKIKHIENRELEKAFLNIDGDGHFELWL